MFITAMVVLLVVTTAICARQLHAAQRQLKSASVALEQTARDVQEIMSLCAREERIGLAQRPTQDVIAQVNAVLAQIGLPSQKLKSLSPEADVALRTSNDQGRGRQYHRQSLRLVLEDLSVREIGGFLAAWRNSGDGSIWTPSRIELTHIRGGQADANRYDLTLLLSAIYVSTTKEIS